MRRVVLMVLSGLVWSVPGRAQLPVQSPTPSILLSYGHVGPLHPAGPTLADSVPKKIRPTYWKEGALIGGAVGALLGAAAGYGLCEGGDGTTKHCAGALVLGGVFGAALVAIPGALIGGQVSKEPAEPARPD
jgi:hypothetical protein